MADHSTVRLEQRIEQLRLQPHPEGGWYREIYRSAHCVAVDYSPDGFAGDRSLATLIYFLLPAGARSARHRVRSEEFWLFIEGDPIRLTAGPAVSGPDELEVTLSADGTRHMLVPANWWQDAAAQTGPQGYSLVVCLVAPGFDFDDFTLAD